MLENIPKKKYQDLFQLKNVTKKLRTTLIEVCNIMKHFGLKFQRPDSFITW